MLGRCRLFLPLQVKVFLDPVTGSPKSIFVLTVNFSPSLVDDRARSECRPKTSRRNPRFVKLGDKALLLWTGERQSSSNDDFLDNEPMDSVE
jgi:hypothetical protein